MEATMFKQHFDLVGYLHERIAEFEAWHGLKPQALIVSPQAFTWLVSAFAEDQQYYGVSPIDPSTWTYNTGTACVRIIIDEMAEDFQAKIL